MTAGRSSNQTGNPMRMLRPGLLGLLALSAAMPALAAPQNDAATLIIALSGDVNTLDPHMTASIGSDLSVASHIYPALVLRGPDMKLRGDVATEWAAVDDQTWRFTLNPAAKFADGEKIDAAAVKWNMERVMDPAKKSRIASWFAPIAEINVIDPTTLEIRTKTPFPALPDQLSMFFLLPPDWAGTNDPATTTTSGGPYMIAERVPGSSITLKPNPDYWGETPKFETVVFEVIPEDAARAAALRAGEIDFAKGIALTEVKRLDAEPGVTAGAIPSSRMAFLKINTRKAPMENKAFRQALNYAVDKEAIAEVIFDGYTQPANCQILTPDYSGYNPDLKPYPYDPDKAQELLKASGVDLGQEIELEVPTATYVQGSEAVQAIASQLEEVGLKVRITEMSFGSFMDKQIKAKDLAQLAYLTYAWPTLDADGMLSLFTPGNAYDYWDSEPFGQIVAEGRSTTDPAKRTEIYKRATELMCEEAPIVFLFDQPVSYAVRDDLTWHARGDDWVRAWDFDAK